MRLAKLEKVACLVMAPERAHRSSLPLACNRPGTSKTLTPRNTKEVHRLVEIVSTFGSKVSNHLSPLGNKKIIAARKGKHSLKISKIRQHKSFS